MKQSLPKKSILILSAPALLLLVLLVLSTSECFAQTWQWGKRGGGTGEFQNVFETVNGLATDKAGNVYAIGDAWYPGINVDGHNLSGSGNNNVILASWTCDGHYRWSKVIRSNASCRGIGLKSDTLGGIYVAGNMVGYQQYAPTHFDNDTTVNNTFRDMFLVKYDTGGNYQWLRLPQPDTITTATNSANILDIDVDPAGNNYLFCLLVPGAYANGNYVVSQRGLYLLKYDAAGNFTGGSALAMGYRNVALAMLHMKRDHRSGRLYFSGTIDPVYNHDTLFMGNTVIDHSTFIGCYDAQGNNIWAKQGTTTGYLCGFKGNPIVDNSGNLYVCGNMIDGENFNGLTFSNTAGPYNMMPVVLKLDSNGNNIWMRQGITNAASEAHNMALSSNGELVLTGDYAGSLSWSGFSKMFNHIVNTGYDIFLTRFNQLTGAVTGMDSVASDFGANEFTSFITADRKGNVYTGGQFTSELYIAQDVLVKSGGSSDWFVAKYGFANCNCTLPVSVFTYSITTSNTIQFTYGGSVLPDSVRWTFGDGGTSTQQSPLHQYANTGSYTVCLRTYNNCGYKDSCQTLQIATGIGQISGPNVQVYPNPAHDRLTI